MNKKPREGKKRRVLRRMGDDKEILMSKPELPEKIGPIYRAGGDEEHPWAKKLYDMRDAFNALLDHAKWMEEQSEAIMSNYQHFCAAGHHPTPQERESAAQCDHCYGTDLKTKEFLGDKCTQCNCIMNLKDKPEDTECQHEWEKATIGRFKVCLNCQITEYEDGRQEQTVWCICAYPDREKREGDFTIYVCRKCGRPIKLSLFQGKVR